MLSGAGRHMLARYNCITISMANYAIYGRLHLSVGGMTGTLVREVASAVNCNGNNLINVCGN